jgi:hypothetical protein
MQAHPSPNVGDSMRYRYSVGLISAALFFSVASEAAAQTAPPDSSQPESSTDSPQPSTRYEWKGTESAAYKWEAAYLTLSAIDGAETIDCLNRHICSEGNPIWGRHPSSTKIVITKLGLGLIHFTLFKLIADRDPKTALRAAQVSAVVQGGVVLLNAHWTFR